MTPICPQEIDGTFLLRVEVGDCLQVTSVEESKELSRSPRSAKRAVKPQVLRGSKQEIAESLVRINGEVREAIVFVEEPMPAAPGGATPDAQNLFAEMRAFMVDVPDVDDSREAVYSRVDGE